MSCHRLLPFLPVPQKLENSNQVTSLSSITGWHHLKLAMSETMANILLTGATGYIGSTVLEHLMRSEEPRIKPLTIEVFIRDRKAAEVLLKAHGSHVPPILWTGFTDIPFVTDTAGNYDIINAGIGSSQTRPRPLTLRSCLARIRLSRRGSAMSSWRSLRKRSWAVSWIGLSGAGRHKIMQGTVARKLLD